MTYLGFRVKKEEFLKKSVAANRIILRLCAIFVLIIECVNMMRVLFLSGAGLGTLNNRIYFGFYLLYFIFGTLFLMLDVCFKLSEKTRNLVYMATGSAFLLWHTLFNVYDIYRSDAVGNFTIITAVVAFSSLFIMRPVYAMSNLAANYLIFVFFLQSRFSSGEVINFTITILLCAVIYFVRYRHFCIEVSQENRLNDVQYQLSETRRSLQLSVEQYELIREMGSSVMFEWDINKDIIRFSKEWTKWFDTSEEIVHLEKYIKNSDKLSDEIKEVLFRCMQNIRNDAGFQKQELFLPMKTGKNGWFELHAVAQTDAQGKPVYGLGMLSDITERNEKLHRLERDIRRDLSTGVFNKAEIERYGEQKLKELCKGEMLAALILDMDDFKDINDHYGHPAGDYVLKNVADIMFEKAPMGARVGRIGGDEFLVLLATDNVWVLYNYGKELVEEVSKIKWQGKDIGVSCSIGFSAANEKTNYQELYRNADDALYHAKQSGKRQILNYNAGAGRPPEETDTAVRQKN